MRISGLLVLSHLSAVFALAQIPNAGFEDWSGNEPNGWRTSNAPPVYTNVVRSDTAHGGLHSARGDAVLVGGVSVIQPVLQAGPNARGFAVSVRHASVTGWYRLTAVSGDLIAYNFGMYKAKTGIGIGAMTMGPASQWTQFTVPIGYFAAGVPDTCILQISLVGAAGAPHIGSTFLVDDLAFSGVNSVDESALPTLFALEQNYPNPFNPSTTITYHLAKECVVRLAVYDGLGREVETVHEARLSAGSYSTEFNAIRLASGMYVYRLTASPVDGSPAVARQRTMMLAK